VGTLKERLARELIESMKAREKVRLGALRLLSASIKNREVEFLHEVSDEEFVDVAIKEVKRRREAIEAYEAAGRADRAATEREEQKVLEAYVPAGLTEGEVSELIDEAIASTGASGPGEMGKVMSYVMAKAKGRVDGKAVQAQVRARLG
jgi:uncharacterized protein YqeY